MKIRQEEGFAMISAVILSSILYSYALSYMDLLVGQTWTIRAAENSVKAEAIAEAAAEEVLWEYSYGGADLTAAEGWTTSGTTKTKNVATFTNTAGVTIGSYTVVVTNWNSSNAQVAVSAVLNSAGQANTADLMFGIVPRPSFTGAILSGGQITVNGSNVINSYVSSVGPYGGSNIHSNGDISTTSGGVAATLNGSNTIQGDVSVGTGGTWTNSGSNTVTGVFSSGYSNAIGSNTVPSSLTGLGTTSMSGTVLNAGNYKYSSWSVNGSKNITVNGNVSIYVVGAITINGSNTFTLAPGAKLTVYTGGNITFNGSNRIIQSSGSQSASSVQFYGTSTCTTLNMNGSNTILGVFNTPQANYTMNGSNTLYGAVISDDPTINGSNKIRYDESLLTSGIGGGYKLNWARRTN